MEQFITDYWGVLLAALLIIFGLVWIMRGRHGQTLDDIAPGAEIEADRTFSPAPEARPRAMSEALPPQEKPAEASAAPASEPAAGPDIAPATGAPDNLQLLKGVGPKLHARLTELGITRFDQIAAWTAEDAAKVDEHLGNFKGRIERDNWIDQAGYLARGDQAGFEAKYGALGAEL